MCGLSRAEVNSSIVWREELFRVRAEKEGSVRARGAKSTENR